jgi:hypothetical protein
MWDLSCPDWEHRIRNALSLIPDLPLNRAEVGHALAIFNRLRLPDVAGTPTLAQAGGQWFRDIVGAWAGAWEPAARKREISEILCLVPKKNSKTTGGTGLMLTAMMMNQRHGPNSFWSVRRRQSDGCTASHSQPRLLLMAELAQISDAGPATPASATGQIRTRALQQISSYSMTSSARSKIDCGTVKAERPRAVRFRGRLRIVFRSRAVELPQLPPVLDRPSCSGTLACGALGHHP